MPNIFDVAKHFDDITVTDAYTSAYLFKAQTSSFLGSSPDGTAAKKRVLSVAPGITLPARGAITCLGETYILGTAIQDGFSGASIRQSIWSKLVTDSFTILTPGEAALASSGLVALGYRQYLKDTVNSLTDAEYDPFWDIFFAMSEPVLKGSFLIVGTKFYRARSVHLDEAGFTAAASDELDEGSRVALTFSQTGAYDPVLDVYAGGSVATFGFLLDRYKAYDLLTQDDARNLAGDMTLVVAASAVTPVVGRNVTISGQSWNILNRTAEQDAWMLHVRRT